jgi:hypothetical protein
MGMNIRAVYRKPLERYFDEAVEIDRRMLQKVGRELVKEVQREIRRMNWDSNPAKLISSIKFRTTENRVIVYSTHPAAEYLEFGVKPHDMGYLEGVIPMDTPDGTVFRTAPGPGKAPWKHPGMKAKKFVDRGVRKGRQKAAQIIANEIAARAGGR